MSVRRPAQPPLILMPHGLQDVARSLESHFAGHSRSFLLMRRAQAQVAAQAAAVAAGRALPGEQCCTHHALECGTGMLLALCAGQAQLMPQLPC